MKKIQIFILISIIFAIGCSKPNQDNASSPENTISYGNYVDCTTHSFEAGGQVVSISGKIIQVIQGAGSRSEWGYTIFETPAGQYFLSGVHWMGVPNYNIGNIGFSELSDEQVVVQGYPVTIYPYKPENASLSQLENAGSLENTTVLGFLITSIDGYTPLCCYQNISESDLQTCFWAPE